MIHGLRALLPALPNTKPVFVTHYTLFRTQWEVPDRCQRIECNTLIHCGPPQTLLYAYCCRFDYNVGSAVGEEIIPQLLSEIFPKSSASGFVNVILFWCRFREEERDPYTTIQKVIQPTQSAPPRAQTFEEALLMQAPPPKPDRLYNAAEWVGPPACCYISDKPCIMYYTNSIVWQSDCGTSLPPFANETANLYFADHGKPISLWITQPQGQLRITGLGQMIHARQGISITHLSRTATLQTNQDIATNHMAIRASNRATLTTSRNILIRKQPIQHPSQGTQITSRGTRLTSEDILATNKATLATSKATLATRATLQTNKVIRVTIIMQEDRITPTSSHITVSIIKLVNRTLRIIQLRITVSRTTLKEETHTQTGNY